VVPRLLIPPAVVKRCDPVVNGPKAIASGFATVVKENPKATMNNPDNINGKKPYYLPQKSNVPVAEIVI
jgi:hypothetical protein